MQKINTSMITVHNLQGVDLHKRSTHIGIRYPIDFGRDPVGPLSAVCQKYMYM